MRTGLSTIQQTLTPEAAAVLNHSIAEAARRNHGQTTPLHVAATLLASPTGHLRRACIRSHPNSSHPLQCRALELCFSVALDRLPSTAGAAAAEPPISNALMAALKRAQAHQRRGCPESQQQPLLAVKVELEQLIVSILDDPSVSRVMREASFSSPVVKASIEQSMASTPTSTASSLTASPLTHARPSLVPINRNQYINPKLQQGKQEEEVQKVLDVMARARRRNPVLVGDSDPEAVLREVLWRIENREVRDGSLRNAQVIVFAPESDRSAVAEKLVELRNSVEARVGCGGGVVINLGDLNWFVEGAGQQQTVSEVGRTVAAEVGKLIRMFADGGGQVWVIGTATCATYLRCQVYHPAMESDWDLQAVPISPKAPQPFGSFQRGCGNGILSSSVEKLAPNRGFPAARPATAASLLSRPPPSEGVNPSHRTMCPACTENYERELSTLVVKEVEKKSASDFKPEARPTLPRWLQAVRPTPQVETRDQELTWKKSTEGLLQRWNETCSRLHPSFQQPVASSRPPPLGRPALSIANLNYLATPLCKTTLQLKPPTLQMSNRECEDEKPPASFNWKMVSPPRSPVRTDLILGRPKLSEPSQSHKERLNDSAGCTQDLFLLPQKGRLSSSFDSDSFKRLFKGLTERVSWQQDAASAVSMAISQCRSGNGKKRSGGPKADTWLLFMGPDKVGKRKMASALSELVFGSGPTTVNLGCSGGRPGTGVGEGVSNMSFRGKTGIDRLAEAVRRSPFSVYLLEDVDQADVRVQGSIKRAMERGRLMDSHGREVPLGSGIFIMTSNSSPESAKNFHSVSLIQYEEKLKTVANSGWQFELIILGEKAGKRLPEWALDDEADRSAKPNKKRALSLDLNLATGVSEEETGEGSRNSSDVTAENEHGELAAKLPPPSAFPFEIIDTVDDATVFKPVDFSPVRKKVADVLSGKFSLNAGCGPQLQVDGEAIDRIVAGIWFDRAEASGFEEWTDRVAVPSFLQLKSSRMVCDGSVVRLAVRKDELNPRRDLLHSMITIAGELHGS